MSVYEWANKLTALEMAEELEKAPLIPRDSAAKMIRQQADRIAELEKLVSDMIYEKSSGVYDRPQTNSQPQKVTLYIYNNAKDGKTWIDEYQNEMLYPEWKYMGKIEALK
jgi:hypothetical protein